MDNNERGYTRIYKYTDSPIMIGNYEIDVFLLFMISAYVAHTLSTGLMQWVVAEGIAIGAVWLYVRYKSGAVRGKGRQLLYSLGIKKPKNLVPSDVRYFVGG
jgi:hypothetical protein